MSAPTIMQNSHRASGRHSATHLYTVGQAVRLRGSFTQRLQPAGVYRITGMLPPEGASPQYRIRNDDERHERVATQDSLEPVHSVPDDAETALMKRTFDHG